MNIYYLSLLAGILLWSISSQSIILAQTLPPIQEEDTLTFLPRYTTETDSVHSPALTFDTIAGTFLNESSIDTIATVLPTNYTLGASFSGTASFYADRFEGRKTSCGDIYCHDSLTAAHRTLPFGTLLYVQNTHNGKSVIVRINDRGPFKHERCLDVSKRAAQHLGIIGKGTSTIQAHIIIPCSENNVPTQTQEPDGNQITTILEE